MRLRYLFNSKALLFFYFLLAIISLSSGNQILEENATNTNLGMDNLNEFGDGVSLNKNTIITNASKTSKLDGESVDLLLENNGSLYKHFDKLQSLAGIREKSGLTEDKKNESFPCVNWCRYTDKNLDECWKLSLRHHATELLEKVESLYSALLHVDNWKRSNLDEDDPELSGQEFERGVLEEVLTLWESDDKSDVEVNKTVMKRVFDMVFEEFKSKKDVFHTEDDETPRLPSLSCPVPCDYYPRMWATLTLVLVVTLAVLIVAVLVYLFCDSWSPRRRGKWMPV